FLEEEAKKHLAHVGGDERTIPALVMLLKDVSNKVLSEVKREVEKKCYDDEIQVFSTIIDQLKLK
ncbi:hypothetical protein ACI3PL_29000, partial [Lacticaseibacillus paracasei]